MADEEATTEAPPRRDSGTEPPATPRWVKVTGSILVVLLLLVAIVVAIGPGDHGPGRHVPSGAAGAYAPPLVSASWWEIAADAWTVRATLSGDAGLR